MTTNDEPDESAPPRAVTRSIDVLAAMQGTNGLGQGLTTYPASEDPEQLQAHDDCLALEATGGCVRYLESDGVNHPTGAPFVIWMPVAPPPAP
jgi:hypothetical protein